MKNAGEPNSPPVKTFHLFKEERSTGGGPWLFKFFTFSFLRGWVKVSKKSKKLLIKDDLLRQLDENGTYGNQYVDLIEDYMALWDLKNKLIKDIKKRGALIEWQNSEYQKGVRKNDAVVELPKVNKQMLMLLKELGLRAVDSKVDDTDEEL